MPLDLLVLGSFTDPPAQRRVGIFNLRREKQKSGDTRSEDPQGPSHENFPFIIYDLGRQGGQRKLFAETSAAREDWKLRLKETLDLRQFAHKSDQVFDTAILNESTFFAPPTITKTDSFSGSDESHYTGRVTCSVPFSTPSFSYLYGFTLMMHIKFSCGSSASHSDWLP